MVLYAQSMIDIYHCYCANWWAFAHIDFNPSAFFIVYIIIGSHDAFVFTGPTTKPDKPAVNPPKGGGGKPLNVS